MYNPSSAFGTSNSEIDKYLYVQIKLLNLVEVAYIENRIDETTYKSKLSQLMTKINSLKAQLPHFNPDAFFQVVSLHPDLCFEQPELRVHQDKECLLEYC